MTKTQFEGLKKGDRVVCTPGDGTVFEVTRKGQFGWALKVIKPGPGYTIKHDDGTTSFVRAYSNRPKATTPSKWARVG